MTLSTELKEDGFRVGTRSLEHALLTAQADEFGALISSEAGLAAVVNIGDIHPAAQARLRDPQVLDDLRDRLVA